MNQFTRREFLKILASSGLALGVAPSLSLAKSNARVVIVGGGFGGATCANYVKRYAPNVDVTLIEPSKQFITCPFSNTVIGGLKSIDDITHDYSTLKKNRGVNIVNDSVTEINAGGKKVRLAGGKTVSYDYLVVSPGISFDWQGIKGYSESVANTIPHAWKAGKQTLLLRDQIKAMKAGGTFIISVPKKPFRAPPAPFERASLVANFFQKHNPNAKILLLDANDGDEETNVFLAAWKQLYGNMIEWVPGSKGGHINGLDSASKTVISASGDKYKADVLNLVPPQKAGAIALSSDLADKSGWCPIDQASFESKKHANIFIIGDSSIAGDMPKTGHSASSQAKICAAAIALKIAGKKPLDPVLNTSIYSLVGPKFGISSAAVYRVKNGKLTEVSGGVSPVKAHTKFRRKEAKFANGWYKAITSEMFAKSV